MGKLLDFPMALRRALVVGGNGSLGRSVAGAFRANPDWHIISADVTDPHSKGADPHSAHEHIRLDPASWHLDIDDIVEEVGELDFLVCAAGGWGGGTLGDEDCVDVFEQLWRMNVCSAIGAAQLGVKCMRPGGMVVLTGAIGALDETPNMVAYGMAKSAVHQLVLSYPDDGIPKDDGGIEICAILPGVIDTPQNRAAMPDADDTHWTPPLHIAEELSRWAGGEGRPASGSLVQIRTHKSKTEFVAA